MEAKVKMEVWLHRNMSFVGGFFGAYALINRAGIFGSAETGNMINLVLDLLGRNLGDCMLRVVAMLIYIFGIELTVFLPTLVAVDMRFVSILIDGAALLVLAQMPDGVNDFVALYPIFLAMPIQWCIYGGAKGYNSSSIFSTNNLKQTCLSIGGYVLTKDPAKWDKFWFFGTTLIAYHLGVAYGWAACCMMGVKSAYFCLLPLVTACGIVVQIRREEACTELCV